MAGGSRVEIDGDWEENVRSAWAEFAEQRLGPDIAEDARLHGWVVKRRGRTGAVNADGPRPVGGRRTAAQEIAKTGLKLGCREDGAPPAAKHRTRCNVCSSRSTVPGTSHTRCLGGPVRRYMTAMYA